MNYATRGRVRFHGWTVGVKGQEREGGGERAWEHQIVFTPARFQGFSNNTLIRFSVVRFGTGDLVITTRMHGLIRSSDYVKICATVTIVDGCETIFMPVGVICFLNFSFKGMDTVGYSK